MSPGLVNKFFLAEVERASNFPNPDKSLTKKLDLARDLLNHQNLTERLNEAIYLEDETVSLYQNYTGKSKVQNDFFKALRRILYFCRSDPNLIMPENFWSQPYDFEKIKKIAEEVLTEIQILKDLEKSFEDSNKSSFIEKFTEFQKSSSKRISSERAVRSYFKRLKNFKPY